MPSYFGSCSPRIGSAVLGLHDPEDNVLQFFQKSGTVCAKITLGHPRVLGASASV